MLIQVHRIDENGFYLEPVLIEQGDVVNDENIITVDPPQGLYKPRWVEGEWTEGLSEEEIAELTKPQPAPPDPRDEKIAELERQNIETMLALTDVYERNLQLEADKVVLEQQNIETMLALTDVYEQLISLQTGGNA